MPTLVPAISGITSLIPSPMPTNIEPYDMPIQLMYDRTIENLKIRCKATNGQGDESLNEFCKIHGINRSNLTQVLNGHQEISVALFMKISAALSGRTMRPLPEGAERISLRTLLEFDMFSINAAMYNVNFAAY